MVDAKMHQNTLISMLKFTNFPSPKPHVGEELRYPSPNPTSLGTLLQSPPMFVNRWRHHWSTCTVCIATWHICIYVFFLFHFSTKNSSCIWKQADQIENFTHYAEYSQFVVNYFFGSLTYSLLGGGLCHRTFTQWRIYAIAASYL